MSESGLGVEGFLTGLFLASLFWLGFMGDDNDMLSRHYEVAETKCELNEGVQEIAGQAFFGRYGFDVTCNNGAEFDIPWAEQL